MDFIKIRQYLHQHPEASDNEKETAKYIVSKLKEIGVQQIENNFFESGILAEIDSGKPGKTILFRAELDALPIQEINEDLPYKSTVDGVSHKCGHDGHMTILLGLAEQLINDKPKEGKILLLFQPSEENGRGAEGIMASKILENYSIDFIFALHNIPGYPLGSVICKSGSFTPSVESLDVKMIGKTSHAGMPDKGVNPSEAISGLIRFYNDLHQPDVEKENYFLSSPVQIRMGEPAYGTAAGGGLISYTFRSFDYDFFQKQKEKINKRAQEIVNQTPDLNAVFSWVEPFSTNQNDHQAYLHIKQAAKDLDLAYIEKEIGFSWGEDFGLFTQHYPGAMFGLGAGENQPELHNPDYDFPDELIEKGIQMFQQLIKSIL